MGFDPDIHHRRSIRLRHYDYSRAGAYFVTICTWQRECLFGEVVEAAVSLNELGQVAWDCWNGIPDHFLNVELDAFLVMPNHMHGIIVLNDDGNPVGARHASPDSGGRIRGGLGGRRGRRMRRPYEV